MSSGARQLPVVIGDEALLTVPGAVFVHGRGLAARVAKVRVSGVHDWGVCISASVPPSSQGDLGVGTDNLDAEASGGKEG